MNPAESCSQHLTGDPERPFLGGWAVSVGLGPCDPGELDGQEVRKRGAWDVPRPSLRSVSVTGRGCISNFCRIWRGHLWNFRRIWGEVQNFLPSPLGQVFALDP